MPIINIKIAIGRTEEQKQELVAAVTRDVVNILEVNPEWVTIVIDEYPRENWSTGGMLHSMKYGPGYGKEGIE